MTTLQEWLGERPGVKLISHPTGAIQIFSREPSLWHLSDYIVTEVDGPFVWLCPVTNACSMKLACHEAAGETQAARPRESHARLRRAFLASTSARPRRPSPSPLPGPLSS